MHEDKSAPQGAQDIVARSRELLKRCHKIVYFANSQAIFGDRAVFCTLLARLRFLVGHCPAESIMIVLTRSPDILPLSWWGLCGISPAERALLQTLGWLC
jgi:hypothetical protein